ncbi:MAG: sulfatase-like hydrolase/transferase [Opitutaceae bacterium]|nr:sulfatase-like hydrolase/transferase [Opitutaceae bacterium]
MMNKALPTLLLCILAFAATARGQPPRPPNILLIVSDDQRSDTIRALGNTYIDTPNLDRLVARGSTFTRAMVANPVCISSRSEILTGASGFRNGASPFGAVMKPEMIFWGDVMRQAGYVTWYSGKWMNDGAPKTRGYDETSALYTSDNTGKTTKATYPTAYNGAPVTGFGDWSFKTNDGNAEPEKGIGLTPITDRHIADGAITLIERRPERPFFLHVNFTAPHDPRHFPPGYEKKYDPATIPLPPNFLSEHPFDHGNANQRDEKLLPLPRNPAEVKAEIAAYYAVISHLDEQIGRMIEALRTTGQDRNTIIIFTSDHGLAIGSHGLLGKQNMYEHTLGVPLILAGPGIPENQRFAAQTYLRDLFPTVCDIVSAPLPVTVEGRSFLPVLKGHVREVYPEVYAYWHISSARAAKMAEAGRPAELPIERMVRTERWKLIYYSHLQRYQLFDLTNDPYELRDLSAAAEHQGVKAELQRKLRAWFDPRIAPFNHGANRQAQRR